MTDLMLVTDAARVLGLGYERVTRHARKAGVLVVAPTDIKRDARWIPKAVVAEWESSLPPCTVPECEESSQPTFARCEGHSSKPVGHRSQTPDGYIMVKLTRTLYRSEHRLVMEKHLQRGVPGRSGGHEGGSGRTVDVTTARMQCPVCGVPLDAVVGADPAGEEVEVQLLPCGCRTVLSIGDLA